MSYTDEYLKALEEEKKKKKNTSANTQAKKTQNTQVTNARKNEDYTSAYLNALEKENAKKVDIAPVGTSKSDIAPVRETKGGNKDSWVKSGAFSDGYQFGDVTKNAFGTASDIGLGVVKGVGRMAEGLVDLGTYGVAGVADLFGAEEFAEKTKKVARYSATDEWTKGATDFVDKYSYLGNKGDMVAEGLGQVGAIILTGGIAAGAGLGSAATAAVTTGTMGLSSMGTNMGEAYDNNATDGEAFLYGLTTGAIEAGTELIFGGLGKGVKALGISRGIGGLDDMFAKKLSSKVAKAVTNESVQKALGNTIEYGVKASGEGFEEVLSGLGSAVMKKLTYEDDETLKKLIEDENLLEQFVVGAVTSSLVQGGDFVKATKSGEDFVTGYTETEDKVINKVVEKEIAEREASGEKLSTKDKNAIYDSVVEKVQNGSLEVDTIEEILGGKSYEAYKKATDENASLKKELDELNDIKASELTGKQSDRLAELKSMNLGDTSKTEGLKYKMSDDVYRLVKSDRNGQGSMLLESYRERARKGQAFEADLSQYTGKQKEAYQRAINSGVLNNTNRSHELVNILSKIEADKGITFDYTNNAKLKESGFAIGGKTVNGYVKDGGVTLNMQSAKAWESTVGHEITHVLEGTTAYSELQSALFKYAESKGELATRRAELTKLYNGIEADIDAELTADLVGDYLFSDKSFINHLTSNRSVFQKVYDEIKYLWNVATGKEKAQIEKVKREFDKVWETFSAEKKTSVEEAENVKYHISKEFSNDIDKALKGEMGENSQVKARDYTPTILVENGVNDLPMLITQKHIKSIIYTKAEAKALGLKTGKKNHYHGLGKDLLIKTVDSMDNPLEIYKQADDRYLIITEVKNGNGDNVIVPVKIDGKGTYNDVYIDENQILSVYGRKNLENYLTQNNFVQVYKKGTALNPEVQFLDISNSSKVESVETSDTASTEDSIAPITENVNTKFSVSTDSNGNNLTPEQQEYFKDSKVRDENGKLKVMYHGSPNGDFTVFKSGTYFTENKEYADIYQNQGASSLGYKKTANHPSTYAVYLDIKKPFDTRNKTERDIFYNEYYRKWGTGTELMESGLPDWTDGQDLQEFLEENGYDYDGLILDEGATGGYGEEVKSRGLSYVIFNPEQVKNIDNTKPTSDPDIRFSLSKSVEETKDLVAVHNMQVTELEKSLNLGGLPMPSIAIIKAESGHSEYGDVSLVFPKSTIDPKANKNNKVYGGDAWTPVYPKIEFKANEKVQKNIRDTYYRLADKFGYDEARPLYNYAENLEDALNQDKGEAALIERLGNDTRLMQLFLLDSGKGKVADVMKETKTTLSKEETEMYDYLVSALGKDAMDELAPPEGVLAMQHKKQWWDKHGEALEKAYGKMLADKFEFTEEQVENVAQSMRKGDYFNIIGQAYRYLKNGAETVKTEKDYEATAQAIVDAADTNEYRDWLNGLFKGAEEKSGIRNNAEAFTPSGNRRSWEALHWENNLENVVKVMKAGANGSGAFFGGQGIWGVSAKDYRSVAEIKADSNRLQRMSEEEYNEIKEGYGARLTEIAQSIMDKSERNQFIAMDNAMECIVDAIRVSKTKSGILNELRQYQHLNVTETTVDDIVSLVSDIANMPTEYFEAKPQRAVGFDEVATAIIPDNASAELKAKLTENNIPYVEYESGNEQARLDALNSVEDAKFSLSNEGEKSTFGTPLKDMYREQDIAPVREDISKKETTNGNMPYNDYAPATAEEVEALNKESFDAITDKDAPPEAEQEIDYVPDSISIDTKSLKQLSKAIGEKLPLTDKFAKADLEKVIQDFSKGTISTREELYTEVKKRFDTYYYKERSEGLEQVKQSIKTIPIYVSDDVKMDFGKGKDGYQYFMQKHFGKMRFSKEGVSVDKLYDALVEVHPEYFSEEIWNVADRLRRIAEVVDMPTTNYVPQPVDERTLQDATDFIYDSVQEYKDTIRLTDSFERENAPIDESLIPPIEEVVAADVAPLPDAIFPMTEAEANTLQDEKAQSDAKVEGVPKGRKQLHHNIINDMKSVFSSSGYDFDDVLSKARNLSTFSTVDNTPQRVMEKALGYKEGQMLSDLTVNKVAQNETEGIKWLNFFTDRKNGLLAQISKQYGIKPASKESAAAQMYAEGFYVAKNNDIIAYGDAELAKDFPNEKVRNNIKGLAKDPRIRQIYDETLTAINASRKRNSYPEIGRLDNYFLHFRAMEDTFSKLGLPYNPNDIRAEDLPTDLNGVTADLKPGQPYFASAMHREGKRTTFDLLGGLERYLTSAKNQIYHIDDIQTLRALRNYIADSYGQAKGLESIDMLPEEEAQEKIEQVYGKHLSTFAKFLNEEANVLAGKKTLIDRGLEGVFGRRSFVFMDTVNKQVGSNMVGYNVSSSLTNFVPVVQTLAKTNKFDFLKAFTQTVSNKFGSIYGKGDNFAENSPVIIRRKGADRFYRTPYQKAADAGYVFMSVVDDISTEIIARTKFNELTRKGMSEQQAHFETDKWVSRLMGDRSLGQMPQLYNSKMLGVFTKFQLEVRNQLDSQFYDTIQEAKVSNEEIENALLRNAKTAAKVTSTFVQLAIAQHLFGKVFEAVAGYNPAFDIISTLSTLFGFDDDDESEDTVLDNVEQGFFELLEDLPYTSTFTGGRIPISSALPIEQLVKGKDDYGNDKSRGKTALETLPYHVLPGGYGQIKKTYQGLKMFSDEHPITGSYTDSGSLRFPVEDTPLNRIQAGLFGQYASANAREYFDNGYAPLKEKQIQEYQDVELPIGDYWKYREGLSGLKSNEEKAEYINSLDINDWQKNLLMNNILDRKKDVDMSNYEDYSGWEEFDFAQKNPEKYEFFKANGIAYSDYANADEDGKNAYTWAYNNPEKYTVSKVVADNVITYRSYTGELNDIKADKDENGKSISGSRKEKVIDYLNNLDASYETKIMLFKTEYPSDDTYNEEIVEYLNYRDDLTYEERITIFTELGFTVKDGYVYWD